MAWRYVCQLESLASGDLQEFALEHGTKVVALAVDGSVRVIPPLCPHQAEPMQYGFCDGGLITCTRHFWQWDAATGAAQGAASKPLHMYDAKVEQGKVFAFIEQEFVYDYD